MASLKQERRMKITLSLSTFGEIVSLLYFHQEVSFRKYWNTIERGSYSLFSYLSIDESSTKDTLPMHIMRCHKIIWSVAAVALLSREQHSYTLSYQLHMLVLYVICR